ncbi:MAG: hypothetical protein M0Z99_14415 [Betaproteobacteria bacterium]|nr:hypothetical protein [Betaproteobacteria bacterium]
MSQSNQSGQQGAQQALQEFEKWVAERDRLSDHANWVRRGDINKQMIANACNFASTQPFRTNPRVKKRLQDVEQQWMAQGFISPKNTASKGSKVAPGASKAAADRRGERDLEDAQARIKQLEERNATLQADLAQLRSKFRRIDEHLGLTGRLLPP